MADVVRHYEAMQAQTPIDIHARASAAARLASESSILDVRVQQPSALWPSSFSPSVSMRDILGASLITYDQHIDMPSATSGTSPYLQEIPQALQPKAVYVQYQSHDPVTGCLSPVVVPATMSLDVFADPKWFGPPPEEEDAVEEEKDDNEEEDRQKLRSSIKGDPILMRAKPAPPPDPYFAPLRHENILPRIDGASTSETLLPGSSAVTSASLKDNLRGTWQSSQVKVPVEAIGTMSSFMKARGKDKYSRSRIAEIDNILDASASRYQVDLFSPSSPSSAQQIGTLREGWCSPRSRPGTHHGSRPSQSPHSHHGGSSMLDADTAALSTQMAMHIQRLPHYYKSKSAHQAFNDSNVTEPFSEAFGDTGTIGGKGVADEGDGLDSGQRSSGSPSLVSPQSPANGGLGSTGSRSGYSCEPLRAMKGKHKLRDLDPHIDITASVPTQRLHSNWPDGQRRQLARHFYGLTPRQILEEEEKECLREQGAIQRKKDPNTVDAELGLDKDSADLVGESKKEEADIEKVRTAKAKARREAERRMERSFNRGADGGLNFHRLEVRIRNVNRPDRVVVGQPTQRLDKAHSKFRKCNFFDSLQAGRTGLFPTQ